MLSTNYRLRLQFICNRIATGQPVELEDRIWAAKLGAANRTAATMLRQAERRAQNPDMKEGDMDDFLNQLDIGGTGGEAKGIRRFEALIKSLTSFVKTSQMIGGRETKKQGVVQKVSNR